MTNHSRLLWILALVFLAGCTALSLQRLEERYGSLEVRDRQVDEVAASQVDYWSEVEPIIEKRCVACHACYDPPF